MLRIVALVYMSVTAAYVLIGLSGYSRWGSVALPNIINNYPPESMPFVACRLGLGAMILCTYPIIHFATRGAALRLANTPQTPRAVLIAAAVLVTTTLSLSFTVPNIGVAIALDAAIFGVAQHYVLPGAFFLALTAKPGAAPVPGWQRWAAKLAIVVGVVIGILGVVGTVSRMRNESG
eukprot:Hpha_TRINITY_DN16630_c3_g4::TRINITY_DN16630_c3_g4_i1::g.178297::m.178297